MTSELKPALGELHIPLAKLALLDPRFFLDQNHPARATVDRLAQLAATANFPNKALENRITDIVGRIVSDYENDSGVFDTALAQIVITSYSIHYTKLYDRSFRIFAARAVPSGEYWEIPA